MNLLNFEKLKKKAQAQNHIAVIIFLFVFGVSTIMAILLWQGYIDAFTNAGMYTGVIEKTGNNFMAGFLIYDKVIVLIMVVLLIGIGLTSYRLNTSPAFFIVTLIIGSLTGLVSYFFNYIFAEIVSNDVFSAVLVSFPNTLRVCTNLHWVALAAIVIGSITLYAKKEKGRFVNE